MCSAPGSATRTPRGRPGGAAGLGPPAASPLARPTRAKRGSPALGQRPVPDGLLAVGARVLREPNEALASRLPQRLPSCAQRPCASTRCARIVPRPGPRGAPPHSRWPTRSGGRGSRRARPGHDRARRWPHPSGRTPEGAPGSGSREPLLASSGICSRPWSPRHLRCGAPSCAGGSPRSGPPRTCGAARRAALCRP